MALGPRLCNRRRGELEPASYKPQGMLHRITLKSNEPTDHWLYVIYGRSRVTAQCVDIAVGMVDLGPRNVHWVRF